ADAKAPDFFPGSVALCPKHERRCSRQRRLPADGALPCSHRHHHLSVAHLEFATDDGFTLEERHFERERALARRNPHHLRRYPPVEIQFYHSFDPRERRETGTFPAQGCVLACRLQSRQLQGPGDEAPVADACD